MENGNEQLAKQQGGEGGSKGKTEERTNNKAPGLHLESLDLLSVDAVEGDVAGLSRRALLLVK